MTSPRVLALAAWGDPLEPSTWSGTPANLAAVWKAQGIELIPLNCRPNSIVVKAAAATDRLRGLNIGLTRRRLSRALCAELCQNLPADCAGVLHMSNTTVPRAAATPGVRHFLLCDSMFDFWLDHSDAVREFTPRQIAAYETAETELVAALSHAFPIGQHVAQSLREVYGMADEKITGVGTGRGRIRALQGTKNYASKKVLMVAKQRFEDKGGPLLIEAIQIARKTDPEIELTLVSPEEFRSYVRGKAGVTITGTLPWEELQRLFDEAPLYAMPAPCEPWGLVYAEALATKTPILGLRRAALPELTGEGKFGFLVEENSPEAVANTLLEALSNPARLEKMGAEGQRYCEQHFTWERTAGLIADKVWKGEN